MSPRLGALAVALVVPALPLVVSAPAHAAGPNIICVNRPADTECQVRPLDVQAALDVASVDGVESIVRLGPSPAGATWGGPYTFDGTTSPLTIQGDGNGTGNQATVFTAAANGQPYLTVKGATLRNVRVEVKGTAATGVDVSSGSVLQQVIVADTPTAVASQSSGFLVEGSKVQEATVNLDRGADNTGFATTGTLAQPTQLSRVTVRPSRYGVVAVEGPLAIDNSLIDLGTAPADGLRAGLSASGGDVSVAADHVTIAGGAPTGSTGVIVEAGAPEQDRTVALTSSIVSGQAAPLVASQETGGSALIQLRYSATPTGTATGGATIDRDATDLVDVDPRFLNAAAGDYSLAADSPVVDRGQPAAATGTDREGNPRVVDGDQNGTAIPDMGAYERQVGQAAFTATPPALTNNRQPVFQFKGDAPTARFECSLDGGGWQTCTSPATTPPLADGAHSFAVRAVTAAGVVQAAPATTGFTIDATAPETLFTKKPQKRFFKKKVKFKFTATEAGAKFQCQLDGRAWKNCKSPWKFNTKIGKHKLLVRAVDAAGNVDGSPARYKYKRLKRGR